MMLKAGLWAFVGKGGHQVVNFALVIILARLLTPEAFGIVAAAQVVLVLSQVVVKFGLGAALIQTNRLTCSMERTALTLMLGMALVMAGAIHLATPWLARLMTIPELADVMPVMLITFLLSAATNPGVNLLMRDMRFKLLAAIDVGTFAFLHAVIAVALALAGWSYWAIILATLGSTMAKAVIIWYVRPVLPTLHMRRDELRALLSFGSGVFLSNLMINAAQKADNVVVSATMGAAALGFYSRGFALLELVNNLFGWAFNTALFSGFSKQRRENTDRSTQRKTFLLSQSLVGVIAIPFMVLFWLLKVELVAIILGAQWEATAPLVGVFAFGLFFRLAYKAAVPVPKSEGKVFTIATLNTVHAVTVAIGALLVAPLGLVAIAWVVIGALALHYVLVINLALKILSIPPVDYIRQLAFLIPVATPAVIAAVVSFFLVRDIADNGLLGDLLVLAMTSGIFLVVYVATFAAMRRTTNVREMLGATRRLCGRATVNVAEKSNDH